LLAACAAWAAVQSTALCAVNVLTSYTIFPDALSTRQRLGEEGDVQKMWAQNQWPHFIEQHRDQACSFMGLKYTANLHHQKHPSSFHPPSG